jgi:hypothetical protein
MRVDLNSTEMRAVVAGLKALPFAQWPNDDKGLPLNVSELAQALEQRAARFDAAARSEALTPLQKMREQVVGSIRMQEDWIANCGGDLAGYIRRYGDPGIACTEGPRKGQPMYGNGGTAIYQADVAELEKWKAMLVEHDWKHDHPVT